MNTSTVTRLRRTAAALAAIALLSPLAACGEDEAKAAAQAEHPEWADLTITIAEQSDGIKSLIEQSGAFDDAAYDIKFAKFEYGPPLVAAAGSGDVDLGMVGAVPPLLGAASGQGIKVIAQQSPLDPSKANDNILVPEDSDIRSVADLKGKRIAVPQGSSAHGVALGALAEAGLTTKDVKLVYLPPKEGAAAFSAGKVDAWSIWQPLVGIALDDGARVLVEGKPPVYPGKVYYVASEKSLADPDRKSAVADALARVAQAYDYGNEHPDEHVRALSIDTGLPEEEIEPSLSNWEYQFSRISDADVKAYQRLADRFFEAGEIPAEVDTAQVVENLLPEDHRP